MCRAIHAIFPTDRDKLDAVIDFALPECASQIKRLAEELPLFDFVPGVSSPEEYGRYMIQSSGRFDYDDHLEPYGHSFESQKRAGMELMGALYAPVREPSVGPVMGF